MTLATVYSRARVGIDAPQVTIEVHISNGLPAFQIVGLADSAVKEARDRVRSALINSHFKFPQTRITVNLAPADLKKEGGRFDLPIAIGILAATGQIPLAKLEQFEFFGELGLQGDIRAIIGEIPAVLACNGSNRRCVVPLANAPQIELISNCDVVAGPDLISVFQFLNGKENDKESAVKVITPKPYRNDDHNQAKSGLSDVIGQENAKRALTIAAAGSHNIVFVGPPGTGKSMLAHRLTTILPPMSDEEALETASIYSVCGKDIVSTDLYLRPFRAPHHTCSGIALVGGGSTPRPGEISLAHNGVLFLDELPEYDRKVLDVLREPLETGKVCISRAQQQAEFPAKFQLIAALNPSPTGRVDDGRQTHDQVLKYLNKISGPFLDRIDLQVDVPLLPRGALSNGAQRPNTDNSIKQAVANAREKMLVRQGKPNAHLGPKEISEFCALRDNDAVFLEHTLNKLNLSIRVFHRIIKVARTIADLQDITQISRDHLLESLSYRALDKLLRSLTN